MFEAADLGTKETNYDFDMEARRTKGGKNITGVSKRRNYERDFVKQKLRAS